MGAKFNNVPLQCCNLHNSGRAGRVPSPVQNTKQCQAQGQPNTSPVPPFVPYPIPSRTGSAANYIIPAVLNLSLLKRMGAKRGLFSEVSLNKLIIVFGFVFMVIGTAVTLRDTGAHGGGHEAGGSVV